MDPNYPPQSGAPIYQQTAQAPGQYTPIPQPGQYPQQPPQQYAPPAAPPQQYAPPPAQQQYAPPPAQQQYPAPPQQYAPPPAQQQYAPPSAQPQYPQQPGIPVAGGYAPQPGQQFAPPISLDDQAVMSYTARIPYVPFKREQGAEGRWVCLFTGLRFVQKRKGPQFEAAITIEQSTAPGLPPGSRFIYPAPTNPKNVDAIGPIMGKLRSIVAAVVGQNPQDPEFKANPARDHIMAQTLAGVYDQQPVRLEMVQNCGTTSKGAQVTFLEVRRI